METFVLMVVLGLGVFNPYTILIDNPPQKLTQQECNDLANAWVQDHDTLSDKYPNVEHGSAFCLKEVKPGQYLESKAYPW